MKIWLMIQRWGDRQKGVAKGPSLEKSGVCEPCHPTFTRNRTRKFNTI